MEHNIAVNAQAYLQLRPQAIAELEAYNNLLKNYNIKCKPYSVNSLSKLTTVDEGDLLEKITANFSILKGVLQDVEPVDHDIDYSFEIDCAKRALNKFGMRVDQDFWTRIGKDEVIEIYGANMIQKYRSMHFYELTSYSLLDLAINEWYVLWERPSSTLEEMMIAVKEVLEGKKGPVIPKVGKHLVKEIYNHGLTEPFEPRCLAVEFKWMIPTFKSVGNEVNGLVVTSTCKPVSVGDDTKAINFI